MLPRMYWCARYHLRYRTGGADAPWSCCWSLASRAAPRGSSVERSGVSAGAGKRGGGRKNATAFGAFSFAPNAPRQSFDDDELTLSGIKAAKTAAVGFQPQPAADDDKGARQRATEAKLRKLGLNGNLKPLYGALFVDFLVGYSHWGWLDLDLLPANLSHWLLPADLDTFDLLTFTSPPPDSCAEPTVSTG